MWVDLVEHSLSATVHITHVEKNRRKTVTTYSSSIVVVVLWAVTEVVWMNCVGLIVLISQHLGLNRRILRLKAAVPKQAWRSVRVPEDHPYGFHDTRQSRGTRDSVCGPVVFVR